MNQEVFNKYEIWKQNDLIDEDLKKELVEIENDKEAINDRFYKDLEFGTGGLRGVLGVGTNRMNIYTVAKATKGLAKYFLKNSDKKSVAISYDSRNKSKLFAHTVASVMAKMGIKSYIFKELMPTPTLSYAVRYFNCSGGIMITASHNPAKYNGYKVYDDKGCQMTTKAADEVLDLINQIDVFKDFSYMDFDEGVEKKLINLIDDEMFYSYLDRVLEESLIDESVKRDVKIVYTPLYGAGFRAVTEGLKKSGFENVYVVEEQKNPNGDFPTAKYPNPESKEALELALLLAKEKEAELVLATDPDCDRVGIALRKGDDYVLLTGNEVGILLLEYICERRTKLNKLREGAITIKTIVSTSMTEEIAKNYGVKSIDVLTGFKFIGEQIALLEEKNEEDKYILGFEESYGYLTGTYVRDKDAVNASLMIADMYAYYKSKGKDLLDVLNDLYNKYGYYLNTLYNFEFEGEVGMKKMNSIMDGLREFDKEELAGFKLVKILDYQSSKEKNLVSKVESVIDLPKSNVVKMVFENKSSLVFRPSGTEPKLKMYVSVCGDTKEKAKDIEKVISESAKNFL